MPVAVQAIEKWGWDEAFEFPHVIADLAQTEETLLWLVGELAKLGRPADRTCANRCMHLSRAIAATDPGLILRHEARIMELDGLGLSEREIIADRTSLLARDAHSSWKELERFCEDSKRKRYVNEVNLDHAYSLVEAVAREGAAFGDRVTGILSEDIETYEGSPMVWMEGLAARLAGEMRLEAAVPLLVGKLHVDGDWTNEQCSRALAQVGTDDVVAAIEEDYPDSEDFYRIYAMGALEDIHSDASLEACLRLFNYEEDLDLKLNIAHAVVGQYSPDVIKAMRGFALDCPPHRERNSLRDMLVAVAPLTGTDFPEMEEWRELARQTRERCRREFTVSAVEDLLGEVEDQPSEGTSSRATASVAGGKKPGRNAPCPCGSGRKYKRCCGRNGH
jgi:hypothetical protein